MPPPRPHRSSVHGLPSRMNAALLRGLSKDRRARHDTLPGLMFELRGCIEWRLPRDGGCELHRSDGRNACRGRHCRSRGGRPFRTHIAPGTATHRLSRRGALRRVRKRARSSHCRTRVIARDRAAVLGHPSPDVLPTYARRPSATHSPSSSATAGSPNARPDTNSPCGDRCPFPPARPERLRGSGNRNHRARARGRADPLRRPLALQSLHDTSSSNPLGPAPRVPRVSRPSACTATEPTSTRRLPPLCRHQETHSCSVRQRRRRIEEPATESRHLLDHLWPKAFEVCGACEPLDLIGERADDSRLGSKVDQSRPRGERTILTGLGGCDGKDLRGHGQVQRNGEATGHGRRLGAGAPLACGFRTVLDAERARAGLSREQIATRAKSTRTGVSAGRAAVGLGRAKRSTKETRDVIESLRCSRV
jgi:hypothetical protein